MNHPFPPPRTAIEFLGLLLGLAGLSIPKPSGVKLGASLEKLIKNEGVRKALKQFVQAIRDKDPHAILVALAGLRSAGALGELFAAIFGDMGKKEIATMLAKFLGFVGISLLIGGASLIGKIAHVLLNLVELSAKLTKVEGLSKKPGGAEPGGGGSGMEPEKHPPLPEKGAETPPGWYWDPKRKKLIGV